MPPSLGKKSSIRNEVIMDSALTRVIESSERVAQNHCKELVFGSGFCCGDKYLHTLLILANKLCEILTKKER